MAAGRVRKRTTAAGRVRWQAIVDIAPAENGARRSRSSMHDTERQARKALAQLQVEADQGRLEARSGQTVGDLCVAWLDTHARYKSPTTYELYERRLRGHVLPYLGAVKAQALTAAMLRSWIADRLQHGAGPRAIEYALGHLRQVLARAVADGLLPSNPAATVRVPAPADRGREMQTWTAEHARAVLELAATEEHNRYGPIWLVSLATGMRCGELLGLRWADIDWESPLLRVRQSVGVVRGVVTIKPCLKSKAGRRDVLIAAEVLPALREHRTRQLLHKARLGAAWQDKDLVFCGDIGTPVRPGCLRYQYVKLVKAAGVPYIRIHDQRHTHVTWALEEGADLKAVSERVGHRNTSMTASLYGHVTRKMQDEVVTKTASKLFGEGRKEAQG